ncbi:helix-turn-helix domain-containing protein [Actinomadura litoris]|uniref:helix-turn-helix domain-containing protein n=1 Tax=Actinomadura litoris TaxID=2678616 RepID=UPI001FA71E4A|nr:helix-turn-helix transcriptional regulator [Actinomadura litoris]
MSNDFAKIFRGLMENRNLTPTAVSRASARAESTIYQLLSGKLSPRADILRDIAPVLQMKVSDLFVIADITVDSAVPHKEVGVEIGELVATASSLEPEEIRNLIQVAKAIGGGDHKI